MNSIYCVEVWEDSFGGGNTWIAGYFTSESKAKSYIEEKKTQGKDPCVHYTVGKIDVK